MIEEGHVVWLVARFNNTGMISNCVHPYLVMHVNDTTIEIAQMDHLDGKEYKLAYIANKPIPVEGETVIDKNSYIQLDNTIMIDKYDGLNEFKKTEDKLNIFDEINSKYIAYHRNNEIDENKIVYMDKFEIEELNRYNKD